MKKLQGNIAIRCCEDGFGKTQEIKMVDDMSIYSSCSQYYDASMLCFEFKVSPPALEKDLTPKNSDAEYNARKNLQSQYQTLHPEASGCFAKKPLQVPSSHNPLRIPLNPALNLPHNFHRLICRLRFKIIPLRLALLED